MIAILKPKVGLKRLGKVGLALVILNEIRGVCVVAPIIMAWLHH